MQNFVAISEVTILLEKELADGIMFVYPSVTYIIGLIMCSLKNPLNKYCCDLYG